MKPVRHEHSVEIEIPANVQESVAKTRTHIQENKQAYKFGFGGLAVGVILTRLLSRGTPATQIIVVQSPTD